MCEQAPQPGGDDRWKTEFEDYVHGRLGRVQDAARAWLATMTTLLSLASTVIVIKGPTTLSDIHGPIWRAVLLLLALLVFIVAFLALMEGLRATWGGLGIGQEAAPENLLARLGQLWTPRELDLATIEATTATDVRDQNLERSNTAREHLHRSRILGVLAAVLAGVLAFAVLANGAFTFKA